MVQLMGILNVTPDSFSDGGKFQGLEAALQHAINMEKDGASIIDVGGESSRPNSKQISLNEELDRVIPIIKELKKKLSVPISIDTRKAKVAYEACEVGADIINDISAGEDPEMFEVAKLKNKKIILMHMRGNPDSRYNLLPSENIVEEVCSFLISRAYEAEKKGIDRENIILDPGIGFGKNIDENFELIKNLKIFTKLPYKILLGASRKSFLRGSEDPSGYNLEPDDAQLAFISRRIGGSIAVALWGSMEGISILRVHDVQMTMHAVSVFNRLKERQ